MNRTDIMRRPVECHRGGEAELRAAQVMRDASSTSRDDVIFAEGLACRCGDVTMVSEATMTVGRGEIVGLIGRSGSGKTAILRMLCGQFTPCEGRGWVLGHGAAGESDWIRRRVGRVAPHAGEIEDGTVADALAATARHHGLSGRTEHQAVEAAVEALGLEEVRGRSLRALSDGWHDRVAIAREIVHSPAILFLDGPGRNLDPLGRQSLFDVLRGLAGRGMTIVLATHDMNLAQRCDRVGVVIDGELLGLVAPSDLVAQSAVQVWDLRVSSARDLPSLLRGHPLVDSVTSCGSTWRVVAREDRREIVGLLQEAGVEVTACEPSSATLSDAFATLVGTRRIEQAGSSSRPIGAAA